MNTLRLMLYIIISVVSIINMISYYSKKKKQKTLSAKIAGNLKTEKTLNSQEATALSRLNDREFHAGMQVSRIEGAYEFNMLSVQGNNSEKIVTIAGIVVNFEDQMESHLQEINRLEIVDAGHKKGAAILSMNGSFSAVEEAEIRAALADGRVYQKRDKESIESEQLEKSFEFHSGKDLSEDERYYLKPDFRVWPSILCALFIVSSAAIPFLPVKAILAFLSLFLGVFYILPVNNRVKDKKFQKKLINLSGTLEEVSGFYNINRFQLEFPDHWVLKVKAGQKITVEAYPLDELGVRLKVLSLNNIYSIRKELKKNPILKKDRFLSLAICMVSAVFLLLIPLGKIPYKIGQSINYFNSKGMQEDFDSFEELREYPFKKGQLVNFKNIAYMPNNDYDSYGVYLVNNGPYRAPDLSEVKEKLEALDKVQMSEEMFFLKAIALRERIDMYSFYNDFYPMTMDEELPPMKKYDDNFKGSKNYQILTEILETIDALPEDFSEDAPIVFPEGTYLKDHFEYYMSEEYWTNKYLLQEVGAILNRFNWEQYEEVRDSVKNNYFNYMDSENALFINNVDNILSYEHYGSFPLNDNDIEKFHTGIFHMSTGEYELKIAEPIEAIAKLKSYEENLKQSFGSSSFKGAISEIDRDENKITGLKIEDINYDNLFLYIIDTGLFVIVLLILVLSCVMWFTLRVSKKD